MNLAVEPFYYLDEGLSKHLVGGLARFGFQCTRLPEGTPDEAAIEQIGEAHGRLGVWLSRDLATKRDHRNRIFDAGISVAWIRDENGSPAKHCFLVYNFLYRYRETITRSDVPLYFQVRERMTRGVPNAVVSKVEL